MNGNESPCAASAAAAIFPQPEHHRTEDCGDCRSCLRWCIQRVQPPRQGESFSQPLPALRRSRFRDPQRPATPSHLRSGRVLQRLIASLLAIPSPTRNRRRGARRRQRLETKAGEHSGRGDIPWIRDDERAGTFMERAKPAALFDLLNGVGHLRSSRWDEQPGGEGRPSSKPPFLTHACAIARCAVSSRSPAGGNPGTDSACTSACSDRHSGSLFASARTRSSARAA